MTAPSNRTYANAGTEVSGDDLDTFVQYANTFDDLRAFVGTDTMSVYVLGRDAVTDGYGGVFYWNGSSTGTDDDLDIITPAGQTTGRWIRNEAPYMAASAAWSPVIGAASIAAGIVAAGVLKGAAAGTSIDFGSTLTGRVATGSTITVTGALVGDFVDISSTTAQTAGTFLYAEVTATNTVTPYWVNLSGGTIDPAAMTVFVVVTPRVAVLGFT